MLAAAPLLAEVARAAPAPPARGAVYEDPLERDDETLRRWRFSRYRRPLAATVRLYAAGRRLIQGREYTIGHDSQGYYVDILYPWEPATVIADFEE